MDEPGTEGVKVLSERVQKLKSLESSIREIRQELEAELRTRMMKEELGK